MYQPKKLIQAHDARIGGTFVPFTKFVVFVCCFLMGFLPLRSMAQATFDVDLASFAHAYNVSGGTLNANQAGTFSFELGSVASPAADVLGAHAGHHFERRGRFADEFAGDCGGGVVALRRS